MAKKERCDYRKFEELLGIIHDLSRPGLGVPYKYITEDLGCSQKTAERIVKFLSRRFYNHFDERPDPEDKKRKLFHLDSSDFFPPDYLEETELFALNGAVKKIKDYAIKKPLISLESKLNRFLEKRKTDAQLTAMEGTFLNQYVVSGPRIKNKIDENMLDLLRNAITESRVITCSYFSKSDQKQKNLKVCPLGILLGDWNNYLIVLDGKEISQKILSNISNVKITKEKFNPGNFSISEYAKKSFGVYHTPNGPFDVEWYVRPDAAKDALKYEFHPDQKVIPHKDGSLTIKFKGDAWREMSWYLFRWSGAIVPIKPKELVDEYKSIIKKISDSIK